MHGGGSETTALTQIHKGLQRQNTAEITEKPLIIVFMGAEVHSETENSYLVVKHSSAGTALQHLLTAYVAAWTEHLHSGTRMSF